MPMQRLAVFLAALWWGGISALSFVAVPTLFASLGSPAVAGPVAAKLFSLQCWAGLGLGLALLLILRRQRSLGHFPLVGEPVDPEQLRTMQRVLTTMGFVLAAMLLALLQEFGVAQKIVSARATGGNLRLWHSVGSVMVLGQWLCAGAVLWRLAVRTEA
ncbi:MAG: DUF4149 domain-containing protein [Hydrogenophaga sp.]|jgi:hypothetical protein|uniref:DUF4149 domain-containing protein n=1 Tax=Hydrogenophaga sp. TaxID=1904254 RepID=UPI0027262D7F|nr:DUF4149 domain-containing protein [Hydrogenophaga sp.]MDO9131730.1 DUF4149 domain-containing protein [Hydrogenophaga sp.]MDP2408282.1 DUF4149 domain-containing protein [Hydrogenophaga sp.]MDP3324568.1 DUF4149 domain-containing protein [Hydrogenophaga sp.]MDZ4177601.1 DUF4149 domain-containing protein [Hydrogenophaga sp.]